MTVDQIIPKLPMDTPLVVDQIIPTPLMPDGCKASDDTLLVVVTVDKIIPKLPMDTLLVVDQIIPKPLIGALLVVVVVEEARGI